MKKAYLFAAVAGAAVISSSRAEAQSYTNTVSSGSLVSIAGTGTLLSFSSTDDGAAAISPGFAFPFFGTSVPSSSTVYASTNGMVSIFTASTEYSNTTIPTAGTPDGFIAPLWDDLDVSSGSVYYQVQGSSGSFVLVVEWNNVEHLSTSDTVTFQMRLYQATGNIEFYYGSGLSASASWNASIGVEDSTGSVGSALSCTPSCTLSDVPSGTKITFVPGSGPPPPMGADLQVTYVDTPPSSVSGGQAVSLSWEVDNFGAGSSSPTSVGLYAGLSPTVTTSDLLLASSSVTSIVSQSYTTGTFSFNVPSTSGTYYVAAIVDPSNLVSETNETNNSYSLGQITVGGGGGDIIVTTTSLPSAMVNQGYEAALQQSGASFPTWSIIQGALPSGISLSTDGVLSGTPSAAGTFSFTVQASQSGFTSGTAFLSIIVSGGGGGISITTTTLPQAYVGVQYDATVMATGGTPPYAFQLIGEGTPSWLRLASGGVMTGTPDAEGTFTLLVSVRDSVGATNTGNLQLSVMQPGALMLVSSIPNAVVGMPYDAPVVSGGLPPYSFMGSTGVPNGFMLDAATGHLTGQASAAGEFTIMVHVADSSSPAVTAQGSLHFSAGTMQVLHISTGGEVVVYTNADTSFQLAADGGVPPYTWTLTSGALQTGLSLDGTTGRIIGRVTHVGTATVTLGVSDSAGAHDEKQVFVRAQVYRAGGGGHSSGGNTRSGCDCSAVGAEHTMGAAPAVKSVAPFVFVLALVLALRAPSRVKRRRGR